MIYTQSLEKFDNNINELVRALKGIHKLLESCGEIESLIQENLLQVSKKFPSSKFSWFIKLFQYKYKDGTNIHLNNFMRDILIKYKSSVQDRQWDTKSEKYIKIPGLTSQIQELNILFAKQSTFQDRNRNKNGGNNNSNNGSNNGG